MRFDRVFGVISASLLLGLSGAFYYLQFNENELGVELDESQNLKVSKHGETKNNLKEPVSTLTKEQYTALSYQTKERHKLEKAIAEPMEHIRELGSLSNNTGKNVAITEEQLQNRIALEITREAASNKDWELFLEASQKVQEMPDYLHPMTLTTAIREEAPQHVFEALLARGERFLPQHLTRIVIANKVDLLKRLIPLGLDIHAELPNGDNAINVLLRTMSSRQAFLFLLKNNVAIRPGANGKDPLLFALEKARKENEAIYYVFRLVHHGAQLNSSHYLVVSEIKDMNPQAFDLIKRNIPELLENP